VSENPSGGPLPLSYVLPLRSSSTDGWRELASYLARLVPHVKEVIVVDGSPEALFAHHARDAEIAGWRVIAPDPAYDFAMGKVNGVTTGVLAARCERVVIADDDVRYERDELRRTVELLETAHLVRPQNYFDPLPWHAVLDTGRTLLNRVWSGDPQFPRGDFPGTLAIRRSAFLATGGYDGDLIFENLELMRTVRAAGGTVVSPLDLYVRRLPPSSRHFFSQRVRQAYDDFAIPARMAGWLATVPLLAAAVAARRPGAVAGAAAGVAAVAEAGRRASGGRKRFPAAASLAAPLWVLERGVSSWLAVYRRLRHGGVSYSGRLVPYAANSPRELRRRVGGRLLASPARSAEPDELVGPVAERERPGAAAAAEGDHGAL
jgi:hypothetical protein